jgi:hypothetical protein
LVRIQEIGYTSATRKGSEYMTTKKPNPQDATRRNVQAANKKIAKLTERIKKVEAAVKKKANK